MVRDGDSADVEPARSVRCRHLHRRGRAHLRGFPRTRAWSGGRRMPASVLNFRRIRSGGAANYSAYVTSRADNTVVVGHSKERIPALWTRRRPPLPGAQAGSTRLIPWVFPRRLTVIFRERSGPMRIYVTAGSRESTPPLPASATVVASSWPGRSAIIRMRGAWMGLYLLPIIVRRVPCC